MMKYHILSHTADLRLEVYGQTIEELFQNAALAIADILKGNRKSVIGKSEKEKIKIKSINLNILLVDFLNEILARSNINKSVYLASGVKLQASGEKAVVEAELVGKKIKEFEEDVKAVTYTEVNVKKEKGTWKSKLVLDI